MKAKLLTIILCLLLVALVVISCSSEDQMKVASEKFDQLEKGMPKSKVDSILGSSGVRYVLDTDGWEDWFYSMSDGKGGIIEVSFVNGSMDEKYHITDKEQVETIKSGLKGI